MSLFIFPAASSGSFAAEISSGMRHSVMFECPLSYKIGFARYYAHLSQSIFGGSLAASGGGFTADI